MSLRAKIGLALLSLVLAAAVPISLRIARKPSLAENEVIARKVKVAQERCLLYADLIYCPFGRFMPERVGSDRF